MNIRIKTAFVLSSLMLGAAFHTQAHAQSYRITLASPVQTTTATYRSAVEFKAAVESRTDGDVVVELAFGGAFGGDREMVELLQLGEIQMTWTADGGYATVVQSVGFSALPYLFPDYDAVQEYYFDGFIGEAFSRIMLENNLRVLGWGESDYRALTTSKQGVSELSDFSALKIRVPELPSSLSFFQKLGATPTPMSFSEVFTALEQGTVDGQDNGPILTYNQRFYEAQSFYTDTRHAYSGAALVINEDFYQSLPNDIRTIIDEEAKRTALIQLEGARQDRIAAIDAMRDAGLTMLEPSDELKATFRQVAQEVWEESRSRYDAEVMEQIIGTFSQN